MRETLAVELIALADNSDDLSYDTKEAIREAAVALDAQEKRIAELSVALERSDKLCGSWIEIDEANQKTLSILAARITELEVALRPFAEHGVKLLATADGTYPFTEYRNACAALGIVIRGKKDELS